MKNLHPMKLPTSSPYFNDSKIRYLNMNNYFWKDTDMWAKGDNTQANGQDLYDFIMSKNIQYKGNSIHILIPGKNIPNGEGEYHNSGIACGIGCLDWSLMKNTYYNYQNGQNWWGPGHLLRHELGHNLDLRHSWLSTDECPDTPPNNNCWALDTEPPINPDCDSPSEITNNLMDYNATKRALTLDQVSRMHQIIFENPSYLHIGNESEVEPTLIVSNSGNNGPTTCCWTNFYGNNGTVNITAPTGVNNFNWSTVQNGGNLSTFNNGKTAVFTELGFSNATITWSKNCFDYEYGPHLFYDGGDYRVGPNPSSGEYTISIKNPKNSYELDKSGRPQLKTTFITRLVVMNTNSAIIKAMEVDNQQEVTFSIAKEKAGIYSIIVYEKERIALSTQITKF